MATDTILFFDTETNGLPKVRADAIAMPKNWPELVSISWRVFRRNGTFVKQETHLIRPNGWTLSAEATKIHGITQSRAEQDGTELATVLHAFRADYTAAFRVVAHNLQFDKNVVLAMFHWFLHEDIGFWNDATNYCTMRDAYGVAAVSMTGGKRPQDPSSPKAAPYKKLDVLYRETFGTEPPPAAHTADRDVEVLATVFWKLHPKL